MKYRIIFKINEITFNPNLSKLKIKSLNIGMILIFITVFDVFQSPVSLTKSWSLATSLNKYLIKNLVLEITSRKIFLIFLFIKYRYRNHPVNFLKILFISLLLQAINEVSQDNIFLVFFLYIWSSKVNSIFTVSGLAFCSVSSMLIGSFSSSSFPPSCYYIWLKF